MWKTVVLCATLGVAACGGDPGTDIQPGDLAVGQTSRYRLIAGEDYRAADGGETTYTDAVLVAEIISSDEDGFLVREYFEDPDVVPGDLGWQLEPEEVYEYHLAVDDGNLTSSAVGDSVPARLFPGYGDMVFPLADIDTRQVALIGWKTDLPYCECATDGYILGGEIEGRTYSRLNVVVDNEPMQTDGPGATFIYHRDAGLVRSIVYSWWTGRGVGFDRIPSD